MATREYCQFVECYGAIEDIAVDQRVQEIQALIF